MRCKATSFRLTGSWDQPANVQAVNASSRRRARSCAAARNAVAGGWRLPTMYPPHEGFHPDTALNPIRCAPLPQTTEPDNFQMET